MKKILVVLIGIILAHSAYALDNARLTAISKDIVQSKDDLEVYASLEEAAGLYFKENKYNEFVDFLKSLGKQKKTAEPVINYYIAFTRYHQLKHLEETQNWDVYFDKGNSYRDEITASLQKTISSALPSDALSIYSRMMLWKFHKDQNDNFSEDALTDMMNSAQLYAKDNANPLPLKDVAAELMSYDEKGKAKEAYKLYVDKLVAANISDDALDNTAFEFYKEGNLDLAQTLYDVYASRIEKTYEKNKLVSRLIDIAKLFTYKDDGASDMLYAEKTFQKIEEIGGIEAFDEPLMYLRAFNLEKAKEFKAAKEIYAQLVKRYPESNHADEALFKIGIINTYILRDKALGINSFLELSAKKPSPQVNSAFYQLGLLAQWEGDAAKAKEYYGRSSSAAAKERLEEIEANQPLEYNLKTFLDLSLKEENAFFDMSKLDLRAHPYNAATGEEIKFSSAAYAAQSGCTQVELQYLWSQDAGSLTPAAVDSAFTTTFNEPGTKVLGLVVVSPNGFLDRSIDFVDIH